MMAKKESDTWQYVISTFDESCVRDWGAAVISDSRPHFAALLGSLIGVRSWQDDLWVVDRGWVAGVCFQDWLLCFFPLCRLAEMENRNGSYLNDSISPNESMWEALLLIVASNCTFHSLTGSLSTTLSAAVFVSIGWLRWYVHLCVIFLLIWAHLWVSLPLYFHLTSEKLWLHRVFRHFSFHWSGLNLSGTHWVKTRSL